MYKDLVRNMLLAGVVFLMAGTVIGAEETQNLLQNPGFEVIEPYVIPEGYQDVLAGINEMPKWWAINTSYPGKLTVIHDADTAHGGLKYIRLEQTKKNMAFYMPSRTRVMPGQKYSISVWAKGNGRLTMMAYTYGARKFITSIGDKQTEVSSEEWKECKFELTIPEDRDGIRPAFHAIGMVDLDDAGLFLLED